MIRRYLEEDVFRKDEHWEEMNFKVKVLKSAVSIINHLKKSEWDKAKEGLTDFRIEAKPRYLLLAHTQNVKEIQMQIQKVQ